MNEAKYASLSSGLLARKGAAKPAMRPQAFGHVGPSGLEDLGWNDMGHNAQPEEAYEQPPHEHVPSSISALTPAPKAARAAPEPEPEDEFDSEIEAETEAEVEPEAEAEVQAEAEQPPVVAQQRAIAETFDAEEAVEEGAAPVVADKPSRRRAADVVALPKRPAIVAAAGRKAAFTLRLDASRHLRLRLACAVTGRSAQQIVTGALDEALAAIPEIEALAERVPAAGTRRN